MSPFESLKNLFLTQVTNLCDDVEGQLSSNALLVTAGQLVVRFPELVAEVVSNTLTLLRPLEYTVEMRDLK